jgi:MFS family permease
MIGGKTLSSRANEKRLDPELGAFHFGDRPFYGWFVVAAAAVGMLLGAAPIVAFSFGVFLKPLTQEFHASRAAISLCVTVLNFSSGIVSSLVGFLCDRVGARRVVLPGMMLLALCLLSAQIIGARLWELYVSMPS